MKTIFLTLFIVSGFLTVLGSQKISIKNISVKRSLFREANSLTVTFDMQVSQTLSELLNSGDSTDTYYIEVRLKDSVELIPASNGFASYTDDEGFFRAYNTLTLSYYSKSYLALHVNIPLAAVNTVAGIQKMKPVFRVTDKSGRVLMNDFEGSYSEVSVPQKIRLNISVREIHVAEKDFHGENWDYFLLNPGGVLPDVCWSTVFAGSKLNGSPHLSNTLTYKDESGINDFEFCISKNDIFYLTVYDFDITSFSDKIGEIKVDMNEMQKYSGTMFTTQSGKIRSMDVIITIL